MVECGGTDDFAVSVPFVTRSVRVSDFVPKDDPISTF